MKKSSPGLFREAIRMRMEGASSIEVCRRLAIDRPRLSHWERLLRPELADVLAGYLEGQITEAHARAVSRIAEPERRQHFLSAARDGSMTSREIEIAAVDRRRDDLEGEGHARSIVQFVRSWLGADVRVSRSRSGAFNFEVRLQGLDDEDLAAISDWLRGVVGEAKGRV